MLHKDFTRLPVHYQFVLRLAGVVGLTTTAIGHSFQRWRTAQAQPTEHAEIGQQNLHILEQVRVARAQANRATLAEAGDIDGAIGLKQRTQISQHAVFAALPNHLGHAQLGQFGKAKVGQGARQQYGADKDMVALGHLHRFHPVLPNALDRSGNQRIDGFGHLVGQRTVLVPQVDADGLLALATVGEVAVTRNQAQQLPQGGAALLAELAFAGLHQQLVTHLQFRQL